MVRCFDYETIKVVKKREAVDSALDRRLWGAPFQAWAEQMTGPLSISLG
jgi:hypothetical protein